jgi:outer membrane immunogenic protein
MRAVFCALAVVAAIPVSNAFAADMPLKAPPIPYVSYNWTGLYVGANVGYGWGSDESTNVNGNAPFPAGLVRNTDPDGGLAGFQLGYNYQFPSNWVVGVEGQFSWSHLTGSNSLASAVPLFVHNRFSTTNDDITSLSTVTGRIGHAFNNYLVYVKGGAAWAQINTTGPNTDPALGGTLVATTTGSEDRSGWTVGLGAEWGFWQNWSARLEYDYMDFGTRDVSDSSAYFNGFHGLPVLVRSADLNVSVVEAGLNYRFNWMH